MDEVKSYNIPTVYYCAPHDLERVIAYLYEKLGDRPLTVVKELTKLHETVYKGTLSNIEITNDKGEFVLIVEPVEVEKDDIDLEAQLKKLMDEGLSKSEATKRVSKEYNIPKNEVYAVAVKL